MQDLTRDVLRIDAVPSTSLDNVREWLQSMDIKFYENKINLNWKPILKSILEDPEGFINEGGWDFLDAEAGSEGEDEDDGALCQQTNLAEHVNGRQSEQKFEWSENSRVHPGREYPGGRRRG